MQSKPSLLFHEPLTPKQYLDRVLELYPYDIDPTLVYTLLSQQPYPHPSLLTFIDFIRQSEKYLICKKQMQEPRLHPLYMTMCTLSQRNASVLHTHQFHFDCLLHTVSYPLAHPYTYLPYHKVDLIDQIVINRRTQITLPKQEEAPILYDTKFPFHTLSIDPHQYLALSIEAAHIQGLILIPQALAYYATAISSLYSLNPKPAHHDFLLLYGIRMPKAQNIITRDENYNQYIGCSNKNTADSYSLAECLHMIQALITVIKLHKQDLAVAASMLEISINKQACGIVICAADTKQQCAFCDDCLRYCLKQGCPHETVFENYGILHLLDDSISATGVQIGTSINTDALSKQRILSNLSASILVNEQESKTHMLLPLTTYEKSCQFHNVHVLCLLDDRDEEELTICSSLSELEQYHHQYLLTTDPTINRQSKALWKTISKTIFLNNILIIKVPFPIKKATQGNKHNDLIKQLIKIISTHMQGI